METVILIGAALLGLASFAVRAYVVFLLIEILRDEYDRRRRARRNRL